MKQKDVYQIIVIGCLENMLLGVEGWSLSLSYLSVYLLQTAHALYLQSNEL